MYTVYRIRAVQVGVQVTKRRIMSHFISMYTVYRIRAVQVGVQVTKRRILSHFIPMYTVYRIRATWLTRTRGWIRISRAGQRRLS